MVNGFAFGGSEVARLEACRRLTLEKVLLQARAEIRGPIDLSWMPDALASGLVGQLRVTLAAGRVVTRHYRTERVPADWWQGVRERWCPGWWLRRWPVRTREIETARLLQRVCPHLDMSKPGAHLEFLMYEDLARDDRRRDET